MKWRCESKGTRQQAILAMLVRDAGGFSEGGSGADNAKGQSQHLFCGLSLQNLDKEHKGKITKDNSQGFGFFLFICLNN